MLLHNLHHVVGISDSMLLSLVLHVVGGSGVSLTYLGTTSGAVTRGGRVSSLSSAFRCFTASAYTGCCFAFFCLQEEGDHSVVPEEATAVFSADIEAEGGISVHGAECWEDEVWSH
jgi:hypothetical protein